MQGDLYCRIVRAPLTVFVSDRLARVNGEAGFVRWVLPTATTVGLGPMVADLQGSSGRGSPDQSGGQGGPVLVAKQEPTPGERTPLERFVPDLHLFTDASQMAWAAHLNGWQVSRL